MEAEIRNNTLFQISQTDESIIKIFDFNVIVDN